MGKKVVRGQKSEVRGQPFDPFDRHRAGRLRASRQVG